MQIISSFLLILFDNLVDFFLFSSLIDKIKFVVNKSLRDFQSFAPLTFFIEIWSMIKSAPTMLIIIFVVPIVLETLFPSW